MTCSTCSPTLAASFSIWKYQCISCQYYLKKTSMHFINVHKSPSIDLILSDPHFPKLWWKCLGMQEADLRCQACQLPRKDLVPHNSHGVFEEFQAPHRSGIVPKTPEIFHGLYFIPFCIKEEHHLLMSPYLIISRRSSNATECTALPLLLMYRKSNTAKTI